jgi:hypothetical protein
MQTQNRDQNVVSRINHADFVLPFISDGVPICASETTVFNAVQWGFAAKM